MTDVVVEIGSVIRENFGGKFINPRHIVAIVAGKDDEQVVVTAQWYKRREWRYQADPMWLTIEMIHREYWELRKS